VRVRVENLNLSLIRPFKRSRLDHSSDRSSSSPKFELSNWRTDIAENSLRDRNDSPDTSGYTIVEGRSRLESRKKSRRTSCSVLKRAIMRTQRMAPARACKLARARLHRPVDVIAGGSSGTKKARTQARQREVSSLSSSRKHVSERLSRSGRHVCIFHRVVTSELASFQRRLQR